MRLFRNDYLKNIGLCIMLGLLSGCSTIPEDNGNLTNYANFNEVSGVASKFKAFSDKEKLKNYDSIYIAPTIIDKKVLDKVGDARIDLVANLIDRTICMNLAKSYEILSAKSDNALSMKLYITDFEPTSRAASTLSLAIPVRIPIGLGMLSAEGEITTNDAGQVMAIKWSHKAAPVLDTGGLSKISDAYEFASEFANKASKLAQSEDDKNIQDDIIKLRQKFCIDNYGKGTAAMGLSQIGAPPEMFDKGKDIPK